jgi:lipopolysaccharide/colanic/teichoic acid biosynthesis glycosyltransferase
MTLAIHRDGPVFYRQTRVGRHGRPFTILKLRTMRVDAEDGTPQWASPHDDRATPLGRILRRTRLDELPQLVNILVGEMSFVGPRPERPEFVAALEQTLPFYSWRHFVRPGLTGWAQINYPYGSSVEDARRKLEYDLFYIRHYSVLTDLSIALRTATAAARGAR